MGEISEMMQEGTLCTPCGVVIDGSISGYPRNCGCDPTQPNHEDPDPRVKLVPVSKKVHCSICNRSVKPAGLAMHKKDKHGVTI